MFCGVYVQVDWKPNNVTTLISHLKSVVHQQYTELRRSIAGLGDLQLTPSFAARHLTSQMRWNAMSDAAKKKAFDKLMKDTGYIYYFTYIKRLICIFFVDIVYIFVHIHTHTYVVPVTAGTRAQSTTITSTDGQLTVNGSPRIARKPGQRRRPAAERARRLLK